MSCWSFFFLIGVGIIVAGIVLSVQAAAMNPSEDFFSLGKVCNITQVTHFEVVNTRTTQPDDGSSEQGRHPGFPGKSGLREEQNPSGSVFSGFS